MASKDGIGNQHEIDDFLNKVDEIENLVKTMKYGKGEDVSKAMKKADRLIEDISKKKAENEDKDDEGLPKTKTGFSKTVINKTTDDSPDIAPSANVTPGADPGMNPEAFMAAMEADARERAERRKIKEKEANILKEQGNEYFRQENYHAALDCYTKAINEIRDNTVLYTNRAQTLIKLERYKEALIDCDWALRVSPNCIKAHIHMGRGHLGLKDYNKARECFQEAKKCDPKIENVIKDYLKEVDRCEERDKQEEKAKELFEGGDENCQGVAMLLEKVQKPDQLPIFYAGGFKLLAAALAKSDERTLFRTKGGLRLIEEHPCFPRCFAATPRSLSQEELDMLTAGIDMFNNACNDSETNQQLLITSNGFPNKFLRFLEVKIKGQGKLLRSSCINFLHTVTMTELGRSTVILTFNMTRVLTLLFDLIRTNADLAVRSGYILNNLALDKRFKQQIREKMEEILPSFETLLRDGSSHLHVIPSCVTTIMNLCHDPYIRSKISNRKELWKTVIDLLGVHKEKLKEPVSIELVEACLGLLANLTFEPTQNMKGFSLSICKHCFELCSKFKHYKLIVKRGFTILGHILPHSIPTVDWFCENAGHELLLYCIKNEEESEENKKSSLKGLAGCTQINDQARIFIVDHKGLGTLVKAIKNPDEGVIGNAALCLGHCTQVPKVCAALTKTDIIKDLLVLARDGKRPQLQQNCAILIAKLAQGDPRHLEKLRELHGVEILHSCMNFLKP